MAAEEVVGGGATARAPARPPPASRSSTSRSVLQEPDALHEAALGPRLGRQHLRRRERRGRRRKRGAGEQLESATYVRLRILFKTKHIGLSWRKPSSAVQAATTTATRASRTLKFLVSVNRACFHFFLGKERKGSGTRDQVSTVSFKHFMIQGGDIDKGDDKLDILQFPQFLGELSLVQTNLLFLPEDPLHTMLLAPSPTSPLSCCCYRPPLRPGAASEAVLHLMEAWVPTVGENVRLGEFLE